MSHNIAVSHLQRHEVMLAYKMMLHTAMKYTLSSTTLSRSKCTQVDRSYLPTFLSHMGINRCTKQLLLFGPTSLGEIGFTNTWTDQGIAQVQLLMGHLCQQEEIGQLAIILLEILQLVTGSVLSLFSYPLSQVLKYCQRTWLLNVWDFLMSIEGTMHLEHKWILAIQQTHDVFLMDTIMNHTPHFPPKVLKQINAFCISLQVLTLADISDGSGCEILKSSLQGIQHNDRQSSYDWPKQLCPSAGAWRTWHSTLQALSGVTSKST
jgi:hypothetical protein